MNISLPKPHEIVLLSGPNGCGKSTQLRALFEHLKGQNAHVSYMPQASLLVPELTVAEHKKLFSASTYLFPELSHRLSVRAKNLSGGQRQMLSYSISMSHGANVFLLDEPLAGLAEPIRNRVMQDIQQRAGAGAGFLVAEQRVAEFQQITTKHQKLT